MGYVGCELKSESIDHLFHECEVTRDIWSRVLRCVVAETVYYV